MKLSKSIIIFDGSNFYHKLKDAGFPHPSRFDYQAFSKHLTSKSKLVSKYYCIGKIRAKQEDKKADDGDDNDDDDDDDDNDGGRGGVILASAASTRSQILGLAVTGNLSDILVYVLLGALSLTGSYILYKKSTHLNAKN